MENLISEYYQQQLKKLQNQGKFNEGSKKLPLIKNFLEKYYPSSLLDYGCGHGGLIKEINKYYPKIETYGYDPGNKKFSNFPSKKFESVICLDVIEHFEPNFLESNLMQIRELSEKYLFLLVACYPAAKNLPDGRNCHLIIESPNWWESRLNLIFSQAKNIEYSSRTIGNNPEIIAIIEK